jgi:cysteine-rich repeat protein
VGDGLRAALACWELAPPLVMPGRLELAVEVCGDGLTALHTECDDGNLDDGDGCSADCRYEALAVDQQGPNDPGCCGSAFVGIQGQAPIGQELRPAAAVVLTHFAFIPPLTVVPGDIYVIELAGRGGGFSWQRGAPRCDHRGAEPIYNGEPTTAADFLFRTYAPRLAHTARALVPPGRRAGDGGRYDRADSAAATEWTGPAAPRSPPTKPAPRTHHCRRHARRRGPAERRANWWCAALCRHLPASPCGHQGPRLCSANFSLHSET